MAVGLKDSQDQKQLFITDLGWSPSRPIGITHEVCHSMERHFIGRINIHKHAATPAPGVQEKQGKREGRVGKGGEREREEGRGGEG